MAIRMKKTTAQPRGNRHAPVEDTVLSAIKIAMRMVKALRSDMQNWKDNLDNAQMDHLVKYEEVVIALEELEESSGALIQAVVAVEELPESVRILSVTYTQDTSKSDTSRASRMGNAHRVAGGVYFTLSAWQAANLDIIEDESNKSLSRGVEYARERVDTAIDSMTSVIFPGMY